MFIARAILIILCIVTAALYARVLLPPESQSKVAEEPEMEEKAVADSDHPPIPPEQMQLVIQTLAPEMEQR